MAIINDLKYGLRRLHRSPGFTLAAVLTLALGIGAVSTLYSVSRAWVLEPFPYPDADRIVHVWSNIAKDGEGPLSAPDFLDIRENARSFSQMAAFTVDRMDLGGDQPRSVHAARGTAGLLNVFGIQPAAGRFLDRADEENADATPVAVISHGLWQGLFAGDRAAIGRSLRLNGQETTVIGITPPGFEFHTSRQEGRTIDIWLPHRLRSEDRGRQWLMCMARLEAGVTLEAAEAEVRLLGSQLAGEHPDTNQARPFALRSHHEEITGRARSGMWVLFAAVALLLLIACANVASMLLARGAVRQGELSLRFALGARRSNLISLLFTESVLLALLGGGVGLLLASAGLVFVQALVPPAAVLESQRLALKVDTDVLLFALGLALLTAILFGLLPALTAAHRDVSRVIGQAGRSPTGVGVTPRFLRTLVVGQIALVLALANGGLLLSKSYLNVVESNRLLISERVLASGIALRGLRYDTHEARLAFWSQLLEGAGRLPGVVGAAAVTNMPLEGSFSCPIAPNERSVDPSEYHLQPLAEISYVTPDYFSSMGIPLLQGRAPAETDDRGEFTGVTVNLALAEALWPGEDPIGKLFKPPFPDPFFKARVIGVAEDVRQWGPEVPALPQVYLPWQAGTMHGGTLVVRSDDRADALVPSLRRTLAQLDPDLLLVDVRTMGQVLQDSTGVRRSYTLAMNVFMALALAIAVTGVYGTLTYHLERQRHEIGVRIALGALRGHIARFVLGQAGFLLLAGLTLGLALTFLLSPALRSLAYQIRPLSPILIFVAMSIIGIAACLGALLPTLRAMRVDPGEALRHE